jgi:hypothetical protein
MHERKKIQADRAPVDVRLVTGNHTFVFQVLAPPPAWRHAQREFLPECGIRHGTIVLKQAQHRAVDRVHFYFWAICAHLSFLLDKFPKILGFSASESKINAAAAQ